MSMWDMVSGVAMLVQIITLVAGGAAGLLGAWRLRGSARLRLKEGDARERDAFRFSGRAADAAAAMRQEAD